MLRDLSYFLLYIKDCSLKRKSSSDPITRLIDDIFCRILDYSISTALVYSFISESTMHRAPDTEIIDI